MTGHPINENWKNDYPEKKFKKKEFRSFKGYCKSVLMSSPLTGVAPIIKSKGCFYKSIRIFILAFSIAGFLFQTFQFLQLYWQYSTVESAQDMDTMIIPAITICDANIVRRPFLCRELPDVCSNFMDKFCELFPLYCEDDNETSVLKSIPDIQSYPEEFFEMNFTKQGGFNIGDRIQYCFWDPDNDYNEEDSDTICGTAKFVRSITEQKVPVACSILYSRIGELNYTIKMFESDTLLMLDLNFVIKDNITPGKKRSYYLSFHHPFGVSNPFYEGISVEEGSVYKIQVHQDTVVRLPLPYLTDCHDYLKDWYGNGGSGPLRKTDCQHMCEIEVHLEDYECVFKEVVYPHEEDICAYGSSFDSDLNAKVKKCYEKCKDACWEIKYKFKAEILNQISQEEGEYTYNSKSAVSMEIHFNVLESYQTLYRPKYESVELFSYIGGYLGMWLGWSLVVILDFFGTIVRICKYPFMIKRKQSSTVAVKTYNIDHYFYY